MKNTAASFQVEMKRSRVLTCFIVCTHVLALTACLFNTLPVWIKTLLSLLVCLHMIWVLRLYVIAASRYILKYSEFTGWELSQGKAIAPIQILPSTVITCFIIVLHFKAQEDRKQSILIPCDSLSTEEFRKLTVELKISSFK